jgi:hypothetical protein
MKRWIIGAISVALLVGAGLVTAKLWKTRANA